MKTNRRTINYEFLKLMVCQAKIQSKFLFFTNWKILFRFPLTTGPHPLEPIFIAFQTPSSCCGLKSSKLILGILIVKAAS